MRRAGICAVEADNDAAQELGFAQFRCNAPQRWRSQLARMAWQDEERAGLHRQGGEFAFQQTGIGIAEPVDGGDGAVLVEVGHARGAPPSFLRGD